MPFFGTKIDGLATGTTANTYITLVAIKMANTAGHRAKLRRLVITGGGGAPQDVQASIKIMRSDNTGDGTSTAVNVNTIAKKDPGSVASNVAAIGKNCSAEPTTFGTDIIAGGSLNTRSGLILEWGEDDAPVWGINQALCILGAPGETTAANLQADIEWEEF